MEIYRTGVKFFAMGPESVPIRDFIPVFHGWIQRQAVEGHLLIDVHDYSHIHHGPGIQLVAHEGNFSTDMAFGRLGLYYYRRQPLDRSLEDRLAAIVKTALQACELLEDEPSLGGHVRFRTDEFLFIANDRLLSPNNAEMFSRFQPVASSVMDRLLGKENFKITHVIDNPREPFMVRVQAEHSEGIRTLLDRASRILEGKSMK